MGCLCDECSAVSGWGPWHLDTVAPTEKRYPTDGKQTSITQKKKTVSKDLRWKCEILLEIFLCPFSCRLIQTSGQEIKTQKRQNISTSMAMVHGTWPFYRCGRCCRYHAPALLSGLTHVHPVYHIPKRVLLTHYSTSLFWERKWDSAFVCCCLPKIPSIITVRRLYFPQYCLMAAINLFLI